MSARRTTMGFLALTAACVTWLAVTGASGQGVPDFATILAASDRSDADRATDKRRDPSKLLPFTGVRTGMKVLDMGAGGGYSTELMARAVGPAGVVYGQNPEDQNPRGKAAFQARIAAFPLKNIVAVGRPFDDPLPPDVTGLDLITYLFFYHDTTYMMVDRAQMNRKLFAALKPGGSMIIADHSAKPGADASVGRSLHRIDENLLRREVEAAGFKVVGEGDFWRHSDDTRDFTTQPVSGKPTDEFVLRFQKP
jgi:predicted methyltransferase